MVPFEIEVHLGVENKVLGVAVEFNKWSDNRLIPQTSLTDLLFNSDFPATNEFSTEIALADIIAGFGLNILDMRKLNDRRLRRGVKEIWLFHVKSFEGGEVGVAQGRSEEDFFDRLRQLKMLLKELQRDISTKNTEPTAELNAVRSYIDAFLAIINERGEAGPPERVPTSIVGGLLARIRRVDWTVFSTATQKLVDAIMKIINSL